MRDPDGEPETVMRIHPKNFGLEKRILQVI